MFLPATRLFILAFLVVCLFDAVFVGYLPGILRESVEKAYKFKRLPGRPIHPLSVAVITRFKEDTRFRQLTERNMRAYCDRHGYDLVVLNDYAEKDENLKEALEQRGFGERPFAAIKMVLQAPAFLDHRLYDWVMWADEDTFFLNHSRRLEDIIDERYSLIVSSPLPDRDPDLFPDARHFMLKNDRDGHAILDDLIKLSQEHCGQFILDNPGAASALNGWLHICGTEGSFWTGDAGIFLALMTFRPADYRCRIKRVSHRIMNSQFPEYADGDLAVAFPSHMVDTRRRLLELFNQYADTRRGIVDRSQTDKLDPVDAGIGDWRTLEQLFDNQLNVPCSDWI